MKFVTDGMTDTQIIVLHRALEMYKAHCALLLHKMHKPSDEEQYEKMQRLTAITKEMADGITLPK